MRCSRVKITGPMTPIPHTPEAARSLQVRSSMNVRLLSHPDHIDMVLALASSATVRPPGSACFVIAIDGPSGSGKTTLGQAVSAALSAPLLRMDHIYPGWDGLEAAVDLLAHSVLAPLADGRDGHYPYWDWDLSKITGTVTVPATPLLVVEGCGSSAGAAAAYLAVRVWLDAEAPVRRDRALARDGDTYRPHWERWAAQERALFARDDPAARADLLLRT